MKTFQKYLNEAKMKDFDNLLKNGLNDAQKEIFIRMINNISVNFRSLKVHTNNEEFDAAMSALYQIQTDIENSISLMKKKK